MIEDRDSKGRFAKSNVPWNKRVASSQREMTAFVGPKLIGGGLLKLERVQVTCPACGEQVEAVARDGHVKGYCAVAKQYVDFVIETQRVPTDKPNTAKSMTKMSASAKKYWQYPEYRAKQSVAHMGKHLTAETKAKISAALKRRQAQS